MTSNTKSGQNALKLTNKLNFQNTIKTYEQIEFTKYN